MTFKCHSRSPKRDTNRTLVYELLLVIYWLARCKLQATLIIAQRVCVCVCVCVYVCVWHFLLNFNAKYLGNEAI